MWRFSKPLKIVTYSLLALLAVVNFNSHVVDTVTKQQPCLSMREQNKTHVVDARWKQKQCGWCWKKQKQCCSGWSWCQKWDLTNLASNWIWNFFHQFLSDPSPIIALPCQSLHWVIQFLLFFRLDWCDRGIWGFMQPLLVLPAVVIFDSHIVEVGRNQKPCCWCKNKTKAMSLIQEQNKSHIVDVRRKPKPRWILFKLVFSKLLHGFL